MVRMSMARLAPVEIASWAGLLFAVHPFAPHEVAAAFHVGTHEFNHVFFSQTKLNLNGFEGRTVFPAHFDDAVDVGFGKVVETSGFVFHEGVQCRL